MGTKGEGRREGKKERRECEGKGWEGRKERQADGGDRRNGRYGEGGARAGQGKEMEKGRVKEGGEGSVLVQ